VQAQIGSRASAATRISEATSCFSPSKASRDLTGQAIVADRGRRLLTKLLRARRLIRDRACRVDTPPPGADSKAAQLTFQDAERSAAREQLFGTALRRAHDNVAIRVRRCTFARSR
jgi:hypothetical protein